jgi:hypothetical protein
MHLLRRLPQRALIVASKPLYFAKPVPARFLSSVSAPSKMTDVNVALCQLMVGSDKEANLDIARKAIAKAAAAGAQIIALPECFNRCVMPR